MEALSIDADYSSVNLDRCIGCGACVSTCPNNAIELKRKDSKYVPPKDSDAMYKKILKERIGIGGMVKTIPKIILRQKI
jgi:ferredoxin